MELKLRLPGVQGGWNRYIVALGASACFSALAQTATFDHPWSKDSPWNLRPVGAELGDASIPLSTYFPAIEQRKYSLSAYKAEAADPEVIVYPMPGHKGVWDPDRESEVPEVRVPHWPAGVTPATGSDGHADIVDVTTGIVHSFFQLRWIDDHWHATQYAWSRLDGRGWGDPAHYFQGARAAGTPSLGGLIRVQESKDGQPSYHHALAFSLTYNGMSPSPTYVYPATSSDSTAAKTNTGAIPMGSLLMLPPDFDPASIANPGLRKIVATLKTYGGYVVDRNEGTPFVIYAEIGAEIWNQPGGWNNRNASDLQRIRASLRPVKSVRAWMDEDGHELTTLPKLNLLSMRGPWVTASGSGADFDSEHQALKFREGASPSVVHLKGNAWPGRVSWGAPQAGHTYNFQVRATKQGTARLKLQDCGDAEIDTGPLGEGRHQRFLWPNGTCHVDLTVAGQAGESLTASMVEVK